jgi:transposase InsO family protein
MHPEWRITGSPDSNMTIFFERFLRLDSEHNYTSADFREFAHKYGYKLEHTAPRDKHANGIAERTVGP